MFFHRRFPFGGSTKNITPTHIPKKCFWTSTKAFGHRECKQEKHESFTPCCTSGINTIVNISCSHHVLDGYSHCTKSQNLEAQVPPQLRKISVSFLVKTLAFQVCNTQVI